MAGRSGRQALRDACVLHAPWRLSGEEKEEDDEDETDGNGDQALDLQSGHGTFISGIVRRLCPTAEIHIDGVLSSLGDGDDQSIAAGLGRAVGRLEDGEQFDVIVMSLGAYTLDDEPPPLATAIAELVDPSQDAGGRGRRKRRLVPDVLAGRASGRRRRRRPRQRRPGVVLQLRRLGRRLRTGRRRAEHVLRHRRRPAARAHRGSRRRIFNEFKGWATWSGTSFAAPKVAAVIVHEAARLGISAPEAWKRLSHYRHFRYPDLGVVFNVL